MNKSRIRMEVLVPEHLYKSLQESVEDLAGNFIVCLDRSVEVYDESIQDSFLSAWYGGTTEEDVILLENHGGMLVIESDFFSSSQALEVGGEGLKLISYLLYSGALAIKISGSDIVYSNDIWQELAAEIEIAQHERQIQKQVLLCALAYTRRAVSDEMFYKTIGNHFIGLPDIFYPSENESETEIQIIFQEIVFELWQKGVEETLLDYGLEWSEDLDYGTEDIEYNPYGHIFIEKI